MASETDLLNGALGLVGGAAISAIDDGSTNANHCLRFYAPLRDSLLRSHHWNFNQTRVQLALDVTAPVSGFAYAYTLPANCLKVIDYAGANPVTGPWSFNLSTYQRQLAYYKIENRKLLSNDGTAYIIYLRRETNPDVWDPLFYQVVEYQLASKLAMVIPKDPKLSATLMEMAVNVLLPTAMAVDGQEGSTEPFIVDDLIWGR